MNIKSDLVIINKPVSQVFNFLTNFNNFEKLMPEQVVKWESNEVSGRFTIKDLAEIGMRIEDVDQHKVVYLTSDGKVPFEFKLRVNLEKREEDKTAVHIDFDGKVGAMLAMMAKRPLTNLVNHMVERIKHHHD
jgi:carbon monoxide dehydrogenase subunit G